MRLIQLIVKYLKRIAAVTMIFLLLLSNNYIDNKTHAMENKTRTNVEQQLEDYQLSREVVEELLKKAQVTDWKKFDKIMKEGREFVVVDYYTGYYWACVRWMGGNHADVETVDKAATQSLRRIKKDREQWKRRPVLIVFEDGSVYCASTFIIDHAGRDDKPFLVEVENRSRGYGKGQNLDKIKGNGADGHYCIHVRKCTNHFDGKINKDHQSNIDYLEKEKARILKEDN